MAGTHVWGPPTPSAFCLSPLGEIRPLISIVELWVCAWWSFCAFLIISLFCSLMPGSLNPSFNLALPRSLSLSLQDSFLDYSRPNSQMMSLEPSLDTLGRHKLDNCPPPLSLTVPPKYFVHTSVIVLILLWFYCSFVIVCPSAPGILTTEGQALFVFVLINVCSMLGWVLLFALFTLSILFSFIHPLSFHQMPSPVSSPKMCEILLSCRECLKTCPPGVWRKAQLQCKQKSSLIIIVGSHGRLGGSGE